MFTRLKIAVLFLAFVGLSACTTEFRTHYPEAVSAEISQGWRVSEVQVNVPETLSVSEARTILPRADIVWREDPDGDRRAQVATIIRDAAQRGAADLQGARAVTLELTVEQFHALTFEAEARLRRSGVHNIDLVATVRDASTGEVLSGPTRIEASLPALVGTEAVAARAQGITQKSAISDHVEKVVAGWLGVGADPRESFRRLGR